MLTHKPQIATVRVQIRESRGGKYTRSESITLYETTAAAVKALIQKTVATNGKKANGAR